jgi:hypothetical protein
MTSYHTRWVRLPEQAEDPERIAIHEALAFGKAVYIQLTTRLQFRPAARRRRASERTLCPCRRWRDRRTRDVCE